LSIDSGTVLFHHPKECVVRQPHPINGDGTALHIPGVDVRVVVETLNAVHSGALWLPAFGH
jgi:hypothetical protein